MILNGSNRIKIRLSEKSPLVIVNKTSIENLVKSAQYKDIRLEFIELKEKKVSRKTYSVINVLPNVVHPMSLCLLYN